MNVNKTVIKSVQTFPTMGVSTEPFCSQSASFKRTLNSEYLLKSQPLAFDLTSLAQGCLQELIALTKSAKSSGSVDHSSITNRCSMCTHDGMEST